MPLNPEIVQVQHAGGCSPVIIQADLIDDLGSLLEAYLKDRHAIVVTDENVWSALGTRLLAACHKAQIALVPLIIPAGEQTKSWDSLAFLIDRLLELGVTRGDTILAFGGGVVGDLTGFAAAILKRGCNYIQLPTTLLSHVDSSVGGKTGINTSAGKNMVGAFHQPCAVFIDPTTLNTLPERQVRAGYAEVVKYGLIDDPHFFAWCEDHGLALIAGDGDCRAHAILHSVRAKARIVGSDERELSGERALLNFGHSFSHALEAETGFGEALLHGEAVAIGMTLASRFSAAQGICSNEDAERVAAHLRDCGLPTELSELDIAADGAGLANHMRHDKKNERGSLTLVLTSGIGGAFLQGDVAIEEIAAFLDTELERGVGVAALC